MAAGARLSFMIDKQARRRSARQVGVHRLLRQQQRQMTAREIAQAVSLPLRTVQRDLKRLLGFGFVARSTRATAQGSEVWYRAVGA